MKHVLFMLSGTDIPFRYNTLLSVSLLSSLPHGLTDEHLSELAQTALINVRFQVLTAVNMKIRAFWDIAPCRLVVDGRFRGAYCLHH
jgi:hypothetical protein